MKGVLFFIVIILAACASSNTEEASKSTYTFPYALNEPIKSFALSKKLTEISGLAWIAEDSIACIQDEDALLFYYNPITGEELGVYDFGKKKDYEGIERVGEQFYILESNGNLHQVTKGKEEAGALQFNSPLSAQYNTEGICYQASHKRLLIACKGIAGKGEEFKNKKAIYSFDLKKKKYKEKPAYLIDMAAYKTLLGKSTRFSPSAISIHPKTKNIYLLSYVDRAILVISPKGNLLHSEMLNPKLFPQPEAITFSPNASLFIATEGQDKKGKIHRFEAKE